MARPVRFSDQTHQFNPPKGMSEDECGDLPAALINMNGHKTYVSCWKFNKEELKLIAETGVVWVGCVSIQPPLIVAGSQPFISPNGHRNN